MTAQTQPTTTKSSSRRALLAGALGGIGAWAASAIGRANPVRAEGETMVVGGEYVTATSRTYLENSANSEAVFYAQSKAGGWAIGGVSDTSTGVAGVSNTGFGASGASGSGIGIAGISLAVDQEAIRGWSSGSHCGVYGFSSPPLATDPPPSKPKTGVYGHANQDANARGVWGFSGKGVGVYGQANRAGIALRANGRIKADKVSGVATIAAGNTSVTVNPGVNVTGNSFVLLTPKANIGSRGLWFSTNASADTITIRLSSSRSSNTKIAWLLLG